MKLPRPAHWPRLIRAALPSTPIDWLTITVVVWIFVSAFALPAGNVGDDAIQYHLLSPLLWERAHRILPTLNMSHTAFPAVVETLFGIGRLFADDRAAGIIGVVFLVCLLSIIRSIAAGLGASPHIVALASALAITTPVLEATTERAFVDIPFAAFSLGALLLAFGPGPRSLAASGMFAGLAAGTKYTGLLLVGEIAVVVFALTLVSRLFARFWKEAAVFVAVAVAVSACWYIRNWYLLGTPIYPPPVSLAHLVTAIGFPLESSRFFEAYIRDRGRGCGTDVVAFALLPYNLTYTPAFFHGAGGIGLTPLAFVPFALRKYWRASVFIPWIAWTGLFTAVWFLTQQEARFYVPALAVLSTVSAIGAGVAWDAGGRGRRILVGAVLAVSMSYGIATNILDRRDRIASIFVKTAADRREASIPYRPALEFLNAASGDKPVLVLDSWVPCYYLRRDCVMARGPYREQPLANISSPEIAVEQVATLGVSYVLDVISPNRSTFVIDRAAPARELTLVKSWPDACVYIVRK